MGRHLYACTWHFIYGIGPIMQTDLLPKPSGLMQCAPFARCVFPFCFTKSRVRIYHFRHVQKLTVNWYKSLILSGHLTFFRYQQLANAVFGLYLQNGDRQSHYKQHAIPQRFIFFLLENSSVV